MANTHLFPAPALVKQWQQDSNKLYQNNNSDSNSYAYIQEHAFARYTEQLAVTTSMLSKAYTTALAWDSYCLSSQVTPITTTTFNESINIYLDNNNNYYYTALEQENALIALLAQALCPRPVVLRVPAGSNLTLDLSTTLLNLAPVSSGQLFVEQYKLYIEPEARVTLILGNYSREHTAAYIQFSEISIGAYAQVTALLDYNHDSNARVLATTRWHMAQHAQLSVNQVNTGGTSAVIQAQYFLREQFSHVEHVSLCSLAHDNQALFMTEQRHYASCTTSSVQVKQVVRDSARVFYEGFIVLDGQAKSSAAEQEHAALLVSSQARAYAMPALEIQTKEVQCRHASAIGALAPEYIGALQLRGLEYNQAQELIIEGFLRAHTVLKSGTMHENIYKRLVAYGV